MFKPIGTFELVTSPDNKYLPPTSEKQALFTELMKTRMLHSSSPPPHNSLAFTSKESQDQALADAKKALFSCERLRLEGENVEREYYELTTRIDAIRQGSITPPPTPSSPEGWRSKIARFGFHAK